MEISKFNKKHKPTVSKSSIKYKKTPQNYFKTHHNQIA